MTCNEFCCKNFQLRDAKNLYKELYKSSFPFEHCWNKLSYQPKWMEDFQAKKQKTKHNATLGSNFKIFYFVIVGNKIVIKKNKKIKF